MGLTTVDLTTQITPVEDTGEGWWVKRDDLAYYTGDDMPSGAKIRQYTAMIEQQPDAVLAIGCHSVSATQVYIAAMHQLTGRPAYVTVAQTKVDSPSTRWAREHGAEIMYASPPYPNVYRSRMRNWLKERNLSAVRWDRKLASLDMAAQCVNLPKDVKRVVVPSGSSLCAAGVVGGLQQAGREDVTVVVGAVATQAMDPTYVENWVAEFFEKRESYNVIHQAAGKDKNKPVFATLPDGFPLDPYYSAKMLPLLQEGDCLWAVARRPWSACR